ncbi:MAG: hypothetical protein QOH71_3001 [Blastocatellia bacterium]|nr:hypothetical protein [Blastocatellia bacterium]
MPRVFRAHQHDGSAHDGGYRLADILRIRRAKNGQTTAVFIIPNPIEEENVGDDLIGQIRVWSEHPSGRIVKHVDLQKCVGQIAAGKRGDGSTIIGRQKIVGQLAPRLAQSPRSCNRVGAESD